MVDEVTIQCGVCGARVIIPLLKGTPQDLTIGNLKVLLLGTKCCQNNKKRSRIGDKKKLKNKKVGRMSGD